MAVFNFDKGDIMTWGGKRPGSGRKPLNMDPQTKKYYNAFNIQKYHATKYRNIEWHFTFEEWLAWWGDDIVNRGQGKGKLVMARHGDTGPYHPNNVRKCLHEDNARESGWANKGKTRTDEFRELKREQAIKQHAEGRGNPYGCKNFEKEPSVPQTHRV